MGVRYVLTMRPVVVRDDDEAWREAGRRLRLADPARYLQLLHLAELIVVAHEDPTSPEIRQAATMSSPWATAESSKDFA